MFLYVNYVNFIVTMYSLRNPDGKILMKSQFCNLYAGATENC